MIVCIDGPAGVGKSTVGALVAQRAGFLYLNSGLFYRAVSRAVLDSGRDPEDREAVVQTASSCEFAMVDGALWVNGAPAMDLQNDLIDHWSPIHSQIPEVRHVVTAKLRQLAEGRDMVVEGRDIGTVVFPDAAVKVYLDADVEARARRRFAQGISRLEPEELRRGLEARDELDRNKPVGRLAVAPGALYIDTSDLTIDQVCDRVMQEIRKKSDAFGS
ncbi:MAG: (d)CMP kinase [Spirochaetales bacterium]|nr:(d)CMP kinase [Spirochaetales bacterium]